MSVPKDEEQLDSPPQDYSSIPCGVVTTMAKHRRGPWSNAEDSYLLELVQSQGAHNWVRISQLIQSRSPKQCRERYHQNLKPSLNLNPISPEEGALIERMVAEMGKRWAEIARRLNGRSDNAVKNWWNGGMNRRKRLDNRRADAAARTLSASRPQPPYDSSMGMPQAPSFQTPFALDPSQAGGRMHALPPPIITSAPPKPHPQQRRFVDTPIPSPSTVSNISRNDSVDAPPSMISDMSNFSTHSQSPHTPYGMSGMGNVELPPLPVGSAERAHAMAPVNGQIYQAYTNNPWAFQGADGADMKVAFQQGYATPYYGYAPQEQKNTPVLPSQQRSYEQLPLPSFRTVSAPDPRGMAGPPSPPRDSRMSLRNVVD